MFIFIAILFVIVGVLLFLKSTKMTKTKRLNIIMRISSIGFTFLGVILIVLLLSGRLELPFN